MELQGIPKTTPEQVARHYAACLDSANLINNPRPGFVSDNDWQDIVARNKEHLRIMLGKDFWTTEDLEPLKKAAE